MKKYRNKYRIASARAQWWDYGWNWAYFVTICTKNRAHFFGEIKEGKMELSPLGAIADILWHDIPNRSPFVELGEFVVMPNHIHGILILNKPENANENDENNPSGSDPDPGSGSDPVETLHATSLPPQSPPQSPPASSPESPTESPPESPPPQSPPKNEKMSAISPKPDSVSAIVRSYKSAVTKHANRLGFANGWQTRYHDHIIRSYAEYQRVLDYIPKAVGFVQLDCAGKFVEIEAMTERFRKADECPGDIQVKEPRSGWDVIAEAKASIFNEDIRKFCSKTVDKPNRLWYSIQNPKNWDQDKFNDAS